jgi:hypothetical protein
LRSEVEDDDGLVVGVRSYVGHRIV